MECFGDVSGHFRSLIQQNCEVVVVGLVIGDSVSAGRCPNKTVRNVTDVKEAKWNDLNNVQKRRLIECFRDNEYLEFGYAKYTDEDLNTLDYNFLLHQDVTFPPDWDLAITGYSYGEIMFEYGARDENRLLFHLDHVASRPQTEAVIEHVETFVDITKPFVSSSENTAGVQAADCFAGAVAEDHKGDTDWLSYIEDDRITNVSNYSLSQLENDLDEAYREGSTE